MDFGKLAIFYKTVFHSNRFLIFEYLYIFCYFNFRKFDRSHVSLLNMKGITDLDFCTDGQLFDTKLMSSLLWHPISVVIN